MDPDPQGTEFWEASRVRIQDEVQCESRIRIMTYLDHITVEHKEILRAEIRPSVKKCVIQNYYFLTFVMVLFLEFRL